MRNLNLRRVKIHTSTAFPTCEAYQEDGENHYIATAQAIFVYTTDNQLTKLVDWENDRKGAALIDFQFLFETNELVAVFSSGEIYVFCVDDQKMRKAGDCSIKVDAAQWNASLSLLAVSDGNTFCLFDRDYIMINQNDVWTQQRGLEELVTVGWGSEETQFQGSAGKLSARAKVEQAAEPIVNSDDEPTVTDSKRTQIHWRADDQFLFISAYDHKTEKRSIVVFNSEAQLIAKFKNEKPIEEHFAVRPTGNYIATLSVCNETAREIIFFEKNGEIRHTYTFSCVSPGACIGAKWNSDATILALLFQHKGKYSIELWTVSNYEWNLKWSFSSDSKIVSWNWSIEKPRTFLFVTQEGKLFDLTFEFEYCVRNSKAIVMAAKEVRVTDMAKHPIPPPMFEFAIPITGAQNGFSTDGERVTLMFNDGTILTRSIVDKQEPPCIAKLQKSFSIVSSLSIIDHSHKALAVVDGTGVIEINSENGECTVLHTHTDPIVWVRYFHGSVHFLDGNGHFYAVNGKDVEELFNIPASESYYCDVDESNVFILNSSHELYKNDERRADSVTSFVIARNCCLYTTLLNKLHIRGLEKWDEKVKPRSLEIGSRLVTACSKTTAVVMQMPRGNLETIHPRPFVVEVMKKLVDRLEYSEALKLMKKHRMDMNFIVDANPKKFIDNIDKIFECRKTDVADLLLASLKEEQNEYCKHMPINTDKIPSVLNAVCAFIQKTEPDDRTDIFTVYLSALLRASPPRTSEALMSIKAQTDRMCPELAAFFCRKWLHHVSFYVDKNEMYNSALSTYDLALTVQVAECTNRDPREYIPQLNALRQTEPIQYRYYRIELVRGDWVRALYQIAQLDCCFDEALRLITERSLYNEALSIYLSRPEKFRQVAQLCAAHHESKGHHAEAMILYEKSEDFESTIRCCIITGNLPILRRIFDAAQVPQQAAINYLKKMILSLKQKSRYSDAAAVHELLGEFNEAVTMHIAAGHWNYAANVSYFNQVYETVTMQAQGRLHELLNETDSKKKEFISRKKRLEVVRAEKEQLLENLINGVETGRDLEECEAFSEAGSTLSLLSRRTGKTSASKASTTATARKRKQIDKKKQNLKEGGEYEDAALLLSLKGIYAWFNKTAVLVKSLSLCLARCLKFDDSNLIQTEFESMRELLVSNKHHIWPHRWEPKHLAGPVYALYSVDNVFNFPADGGMPRSIVIEPELVAPEVVDAEVFKVNF